MEREQHEMDIIELKEQNELLIAQAHKAKSSAKKVIANHLYIQYVYASLRPRKRLQPLNPRIKN